MCLLLTSIFCFCACESLVKLIVLLFGNFSNILLICIKLLADRDICLMSIFDCWHFQKTNIYMIAGEMAYDNQFEKSARSLVGVIFLVF